MDEKKRAFELRDADMYALELASATLGTIFRANGGIRILSAHIESKPSKEHWHMDVPQCRQSKQVNIIAKLRNPFGDKPFTALIGVSLERWKDHKEDRWPSWRKLIVIVRNTDKSLIATD